MTGDTECPRETCRFPEMPCILGFLDGECPQQRRSSGSPASGASRTTTPTEAEIALAMEHGPCSCRLDGCKAHADEGCAYCSHACPTWPCPAEVAATEEIR